MDENIEFLRDFLECDRYRIAELIDSVSSAMRQLGRYLRHHVEGPFTIIYCDEDDPMYELIQLLDGNSFEVKYDTTSVYMSNMMGAKITPFYMETIEVQYVEESEPEQIQLVLTHDECEYKREYECEWTLDIPEVRNPSQRRSLRAKILPVNDALFDESLKPPQCRKE